jgi:hypothetical protein
VRYQNIHKASGTRSFFDISRHPKTLFVNSGEGSDTDIYSLRQGVPVVVSAFLREQGRFRPGRLVLDVSRSEKIVWEHYRFLLGYKTAKFLYPPYEALNPGPVIGRGAWNVDKRAFTAVFLNAADERAEVAVPGADLEFLLQAVKLINGDNI